MHRYDPIASLGRGGSCEVLTAIDRRTGATVVMKRLHTRLAGDKTSRQRLVREAEALRRLSDLPGVVRLLDEKSGGRRPFLVLELLGETLKQRMAREKVPTEEALRWTTQLARTLDRAHALGIVHRDITPGNLLLARDGRHVKLTDLGIARQRGEAQLTQGGMVVGTLLYMPPEQASGRPATARTDQFALALVAFEMLAGRRPWPTSPALAVGTPPASGLGAAVDKVFARALARSPEARYATCKTFAQALERAMRPRSDEGRSRPGEPRRERERREPRPRSRGRSGAPRPADQTAATKLLARTWRMQAPRHEASRRREVVGSMETRARRVMADVAHAVDAAVKTLGVITLVLFLVVAIRLVASL